MAGIVDANYVMADKVISKKAGGFLGKTGRFRSIMRDTPIIEAHSRMTHYKTAEK